MPGCPNPKGASSGSAAPSAFFADHDVLVTPALAQSPIRAVAWSERGWLANVLANARYAPFAAPWNLAGWPAMAVPAGRRRRRDAPCRAAGRPTGRRGELLALAAQLETLRPWPRTAPGADSLLGSAQVQRCHLVDDDGVDDPSAPSSSPAPCGACRAQRAHRTSACTAWTSSSRRSVLHGLLVHHPAGQARGQRPGQTRDAPARAAGELERVEDLDGDEPALASR